MIRRTIPLGSLCWRLRRKKADVRSPERDVGSDVGKNVRSNGECWVATWFFRFAHLPQGPRGCEVAAACDVAVTNPSRRNEGIGSDVPLGNVGRRIEEHHERAKLKR